MEVGSLSRGRRAKMTKVDGADLTFLYQPREEGAQTTATVMGGRGLPRLTVGVTPGQQVLDESLDVFASHGTYGLGHASVE